MNEQKICFNMNVTESCKIVGELEKEVRKEIQKFILEVEGSLPA